MDGSKSAYLTPVQGPIAHFHPQRLAVSGHRNGGVALKSVIALPKDSGGLKTKMLAHPRSLESKTPTLF